MSGPSIPSTFIEKDLSYYLRMIRGDIQEVEETQAVKTEGPISHKNIVVILGAPRLGTGDDELGKNLLHLFLRSIAGSPVLPRALILLNTAVTIAGAESEFLNELSLLEEQGISVLVNSESADKFNLSDSLKAGFLANMDQIVELAFSAWKVISL